MKILKPTNYATQKLLREIHRTKKGTKPESSLPKNILLRHLVGGHSKYAPAPASIDPLADILPVTSQNSRESLVSNEDSQETLPLIEETDTFSAIKEIKVEIESDDESDAASISSFAQLSASSSLDSVHSVPLLELVGCHTHNPPDRYVRLIKLATASMKEKMIKENLNYIQCKQCPYSIVYHACILSEVYDHIAKHIPKRMKSFGCQVCGKKIKGPQAHFKRLHPNVYAKHKDFIGTDLCINKKRGIYVADLRGNFEDLLMDALQKSFPEHFLLTHDPHYAGSQDSVLPS